MAFCIILLCTVLISVSDESGRAVRSSCAVPDVPLTELLCDAKALLGESCGSRTCCAPCFHPVPHPSSRLREQGCCAQPLGNPPGGMPLHDFQTMGCSMVISNAGTVLPVAILGESRRNNQQRGEQIILC